MSKKTMFSCSKCGAQFPRWTGRCTECGAWSTVSEDTPGDETEARPARGRKDVKAKDVQSFASLDGELSTSRIPCRFEPLDRVLGGGLVPGSVTLIGGEPGIGKSTLLAQMAIARADDNTKILYVTGEESPSQVALRLRRIAKEIPKHLSFLDATDADVIAATIRLEKPDLTIVDSVQTLTTAEIPGGAGSISQTKACAGIITEAAKEMHLPVILVGQVNKDGDIAGPRLLEHLVDTVLMLEGDPEHRFRMLRALKHRFGPTDDVSVLTMSEAGLSLVDDPSAELLRERPRNAPGSIISCLMEGHRPILIELQALVTPAGYATPVRRTAGVDTGRLGLLLAVLARRAGIRVLDKDVYANAAGGLKAKEPALDLALCLAIASGLSDKPISPTTAAFGEVGLGGEIRPVPFIDLRIRECARHGFKTILIPKSSKVKGVNGVELVEVETLKEAVGL